jgi:hypothetical protein
MSLQPSSKHIHLAPYIIPRHPPWNTNIAFDHQYVLCGSITFPMSHLIVVAQQQPTGGTQVVRLVAQPYHLDFLLHTQDSYANEGWEDLDGDPEATVSGNAGGTSVLLTGAGERKSNREHKRLDD